MIPLLPIDWAELWRAQVAAEHAQYDQLADPQLRPGPDWWAAQAQRFHERTGRRPQPDSFLGEVLPYVAPGTTVLDVGAGTGRYALPLARAGAHVTAVDSSPGMLQHLRHDAETEALPISIVQSRWEEAEVPVADVAICAHVLYPIADAAAFLRKVDSQARRCFVLLNYESPAAWMAPLWRAAYGVERLPLPGAIAALALLHQLGIDARLTPVAATTAFGFGSREEALNEVRGRLCLAPDNERDSRLLDVLDTLLIPAADGGYRVPIATHSAIIMWVGSPRA